MTAARADEGDDGLAGFEIRRLEDGDGWWYRCPRLRLSGIWKGPRAELEARLRRFLRRQEGRLVTDGHWLVRAARGARSTGRARRKPRPRAGGEEALQAVSARVALALRHLQAGRTDQAAEVLERLSRVLPAPEERHAEAAEAKG